MITVPVVQHKGSRAYDYENDKGIGRCSPAPSTRWGCRMRKPLSYALATAALILTPQNTSRAATPPAYLKCEAYVGEGQILEGLCRVSTLRKNRVMVEEFSDQTKSRSGYVFLFTPNKEIDTVHWNGEANKRNPTEILGRAQFFDNCWRSIAKSEVPFSICLIPPTFYKNAPPLPF